MGEKIVDIHAIEIDLPNNINQNSVSNSPVTQLFKKTVAQGDSSNITANECFKGLVMV